MARNKAVIGAVLPAGGIGRRFGGEQPKQLLKIGESPIWLHAVLAFSVRSDIAAVVLAVQAEWRSHFEEELAIWRPKEPSTEKVILVEGGGERWQSVANGIAALPPEVDRVMVHDVARPFVSQTVLDNCSQRLLSGEAVIVARPCADTVKRVDSSGVVMETVDRSTLWLAQTPQCFLKAHLVEWSERAEQEGDFLPTDEASLAERYGATVGVVLGETRNDKITHQEDYERFNALWKCGALKE